jgi:dUTP pyrophosphatase
MVYGSARFARWGQASEQAQQYLADMHVSSAPNALEVVRLRPEARLPVRAHPGDAGYDLFAAEAFALSPGKRVAVATGIGLALPVDVAGLIVPRSGLASAHGLSIVNSPGLVDPNYRGEIRVLLINLGDESFRGRAGDRIAQLLLVRFLSAPMRVVDALPPSGDHRGARGFGSSGR